MIRIFVLRVHKISPRKQRKGALPVLHNAPCDVDFFEWLDALSDQEHHEVMKSLRCVADDLGVRVEQHALAAQNLLDFPSHSPSQLSLN